MDIIIEKMWVNHLENGTMELRLDFNNDQHYTLLLESSDSFDIVANRFYEFAMQLERKKPKTKTVSCLKCGWEGKESELDQNCFGDGNPPIKTKGCPKCYSLAWKVQE